MSRWTALRLSAGFLALIVCARWVYLTKLDPARANLYVTAIICAVTFIYALITFEILLQNHAMAKAASDSTNLMEQTLRFSYSPHLLYKTITTKDPSLKNLPNIVPVKNELYRTAVALFGEGGQKEFVFAIIENVGRGAATNLRVVANYQIRDNSRAPKDLAVRTDERVQTLKPGDAIALCICVYDLPTNGDAASMVSAEVTSNDFYRDVRQEPSTTMRVTTTNHLAEPQPDAVVRLT
jgi:hypothetical protein